MDLLKLHQRLISASLLVIAVKRLMLAEIADTSMRFIFPVSGAFSGMGTPTLA